MVTRNEVIDGFNSQKNESAQRHYLIVDVLHIPDGKRARYMRIPLEDLLMTAVAGGKEPIILTTTHRERMN
ncbi:hypothetical protein KBD68_04610 [Candidatus Woesebacteria bacterium]|nr:hypothetical protein [Candidatus Woesebacteria bacterium]